jgi:hypothetical protein
MGLFTIHFATLFIVKNWLIFGAFVNLLLPIILSENSDKTLKNFLQFTGHGNNLRLRLTA